jgi:hypothetical protein
MTGQGMQPNVITGLIKHRNLRPLGVVRANWLCRNKQPGVLARPARPGALLIMSYQLTNPGLGQGRDLPESSCSPCKPGLGQGVMEYWSVDPRTGEEDP